MKGPYRRLALALALALPAVAPVACAAHEHKDATPTAPLPTHPPPQTGADARGLTEFSNAVKSYVALHDKAEAGLPKLPDRADPTTVTAHQKGLAEAIRKSGPRPKAGHV